MAKERLVAGDLERMFKLGQPVRAEVVKHEFVSSSDNNKTSSLLSAHHSPDSVLR